MEKIDVTNAQHRKQLMDRFYAPETSPGSNAIAEKAVALATYLTSNCEPSRELSLALTKLEECVMWGAKALMLPKKAMHGEQDGQSSQ